MTPTATGLSAPSFRTAAPRETPTKKRSTTPREAVTLHVEDRLACGEEIPRVETISLITVEVPG
jgi:hypothetical protein